MPDYLRVIGLFLSRLHPFPTSRTLTSGLSCHTITPDYASPTRPAVFFFIDTPHPAFGGIATFPA
ncbi:MAG: hypothetical protein KF908_08765 [Nitrosomonas sp.]|nr:hypothetical protein [Nitrosomonas sp.]